MSRHPLQRRCTGGLPVIRKELPCISASGPFSVNEEYGLSNAIKDLKKTEHMGKKVCEGNCQIISDGY
jgi:hypothetical protein